MLLCMASLPQQSLQSRLFGFWAPSGDEITVLKIDTDSFRYFFRAIPLVVSLFFVTLPKEFKKAAK